MPDPYKKHYPVRETRKNPQRYLAHTSTGTRSNVNDHHQQATLRGPLLNHRKSKKNPHLTDMAAYYKKGGTRRHRKHRHTRRR